MQDIRDAHRAGLAAPDAAQTNERPGSDRAPFGVNAEANRGDCGASPKSVQAASLCNLREAERFLLTLGSAHEDRGTALEIRDAADKRWQSARACAALAGVELHVIEGDRGRPLYIGTKWAMTVSFDDMASVEAWLNKVAGKDRVFGS